VYCGLLHYDLISAPREGVCVDVCICLCTLCVCLCVCVATGSGRLGRAPFFFKVSRLSKLEKNRHKRTKSQKRVVRVCVCVCVCVSISSIIRGVTAVCVWPPLGVGQTT